MTIVALVLAYAVLVQFNEYRGWCDLERCLTHTEGTSR